MTTRTPPNLLTTTEAAAALEVSPETVARWVRQGRMPYLRLPSGQARIRRADLDAILTPVAPRVAS